MSRAEPIPEAQSLRMLRQDQQYSPPNKKWENRDHRKHARINATPGSELVPAAQYLRMSTRHQQYSLANQEAAIRNYAARNGFRIIRSYKDHGKTGVNLRQRAGLKSLLQDVRGGVAKFKAVLVYDISRWGRFQNTDESASYEYLCKKAGISVHYCAESFANDGTLSSFMMKALKRIMAAEFSRELSVKVYEGQRRLTQFGFKMGGSAPFGMRRLMISADGKPMHKLEPGERKSMPTCRVILVPGPRSEVDCVRRIFVMAATERKAPRTIASELNRENIKYAGGRRWTSSNVYEILINPVYAGCSVWGRSTQRIRGPRKQVPTSQWIVTPKSYAPIVDMATFEVVGQMISSLRKKRRKTDEELLGKLALLLSREGRLNSRIISREPQMFRVPTYLSHFGSLLEAYKRIGYESTHRGVKTSEHLLRTHALRRQLLKSVTGLFPGTVEIVRDPGLLKPIIEIDRTIRVSLFLCRECTELPALNRRWLLRIRPLDRGKLALVALVDSDFRHIRAFHLLPPLGDSVRLYKLFREDDPWFRRGETLNALSGLCAAARRISATNQTLEQSSPYPSAIPLGGSATFEATCFSEVNPLVKCRGTTEGPQIPVAQYVRMSTDRQRYSIENQSDVIAQFANEHGMKIVKTYQDWGKSGVQLAQRRSLMSLLHDVTSGNVDYKAILVFDVSRLGRFQDPDEPAHYDFLCRSCGVPIYYCAESFPNDETLPSSMLKSLKRMMAGEFSRNLGKIIFDGAKRAAMLGHKMGGAAVFGLRRQAVSIDGEPKGRLNSGERKFLLSDYVKLVPGPEDELKLVRRIFRELVALRKNPSQIACALNRDGLLRAGRPWTRRSVCRVLRNPQYAGRNVWNRETRRLGTTRTTVPPAEWVVRNGAFESVIAPRIFDLAQTAIKQQRRWSDTKIITSLKHLLAAKGKITERLVEKTAGMPDCTTLKRRFGSLRNVWKMAGYELAGRYVLSSTTHTTGVDLRKKLIERIVALFPERLTSFRLPGRRRCFLRLDDEIVISVLFCRKERTKTAHSVWQLYPNLAERDNITLVCLLNRRSTGIWRSYIFPGINFVTYHQIKRADPWLSQGVLLEDLAAFCDVVTKCNQDRRDKTLVQQGNPSSLGLAVSTSKGIQNRCSKANISD